MTKPKWATSERQTYLVKLFIRSSGFCVFGEANCTIPEHHYEIAIERLIDDWQAEDREQANLDWQAERKVLHSLGERKTPLRGRFSNISQDIWHDQQPLFYVENLGMNGITLKPFAKVKLSSSYMRLYVDLGDCLRNVSKNKRRKAIRYGKPLPKSVDNRIADKVWQAVKHYLNY
ncbi:MAG: hypothetical protein Q8O16_04040 [Dehalococcoidia bacterium]|nr:hypothetical protein [Dehalococcoidia bacterium]